MHPILRNILAFIASLFIGGAVNMAIVKLGPSIFPPPEGTDFTTMEGLKASFHLLEPKHFIMPFLAHAWGTFIGALLVAKLAATHKLMLAMIIGILFLVGGISMVVMLPSPLWFTILDIGVAYLPMAYFGAKLGMRGK